MSIVVDASVIASLLLGTDAEARWCESLLREHEFFAPQLLLVEVSSVLRRLELAGRISPLNAGLAYQDLQDLEITLFPFEPLADRIWALRHNLNSYDAWYVALAEALQMPLASLDRKLQSASPARCDVISFEGTNL